MASISHDANGTKRVQFVDGSGMRHTIRLGAMSVRSAESFRLRVESLLECKENSRAHDPELCAWLRDLPDRLHARLVRVALAGSRTKPEVVTLGKLLDRFGESGSVKQTTRASYKQAAVRLRALLGEHTPLASITPADAEDWRKSVGESLKGKKKPAPGGKATDQTDPPKYAAATVSKWVQVAKTIFSAAVRWRLIPTSPFAHLKKGSQTNPARQCYVSHESIRAILAACPDDQWRAVVALVRFAGLRCPSEIVPLRWGDVNWERGRLTVQSSKTEAHEGHAVRVVPIAPELRPILDSMFVEAEPGAEAVVPRLRDASMNLRTTFQKIITKAGVEPWPRLFHNLRASCATDWVERFPAHVVAGWLGHSPLIAARHYLQTRDAHFELATGGVKSDSQSGAKSGARAAQKAAQQTYASVRTDSHLKPKTVVSSGEFAENASRCDSMTDRSETAKNEGNGRNRNRTPSDFRGKTDVDSESGAKSGALSGDSPPPPPAPTPADPDLAAVVAAWATLPVPIRNAILALVGTTGVDSQVQHAVRTKPAKTVNVPDF